MPAQYYQHLIDELLVLLIVLVAHRLMMEGARKTKRDNRGIAFNFPLYCIELEKHL